ncbi:DUF3068 domain-containing protein [Corynebacterium kalidii]|uniref:DUF3068 domain-containing protein n=1 Tax=Corynebacterium kalidii TaxID=2931982 RepID=A0A9X1WEW7_9CORY|nr:DUF3068 domain-containing protein [Corynebacterium kalidii]MCJ7857196.1 DUF3068 domain-containing protein [Corynebacterium kalidii]
MKKVFSHLAIILGAALLVIALALPTYVLPKGKVIPKDIESATVTKVTPGILTDAGALAADKPVAGKESLPECRGENKVVSCFIWPETNIQSQRFVMAQDPTDDDVVTLEAGGTVYQADLPEPENLLSAEIDRVTLDRKTAMPVDKPTSSLNITAPGVEGSNVQEDVPQFTRTGLQFQFPFNTEKKAYPYFDHRLMETNDIDFVDQEKIDGETVYRFEQEIGPSEMYPNVEAMLKGDGELSAADRQSLGSLKLSFPAAKWGLTPDEVEGWDAEDAGDAGEAGDAPAAGNDDEANTDAEADAEAGSDADLGPDVEMSRYYTVHRVLRVQPDTGVIVHGAEEVWMFYARDDEEAAEMAKPENRERELANPTRTALYYPGEFNDETHDSQMARAKDGLKSMDLIGTYIPWAAGIIGVILLVIGFLLSRSAGRHRG